MLTEEQAQKFARGWIEAWNSRDLDEILAHYAEEVVLVSPIAAKLLGDPSGTVSGKGALREYFKKGLEVYPDLEFELIDVMWGMGSVVLYYSDRNGIKAGEVAEVDVTGKIIRVLANYNR